MQDDNTWRIWAHSWEISSTGAVTYAKGQQIRAALLVTLTATAQNHEYQMAARLRRYDYDLNARIRSVIYADDEEAGLALSVLDIGVLAFSIDHFHEEGYFPCTMVSGIGSLDLNPRGLHLSGRGMPCLASLTNLWEIVAVHNPVWIEDTKEGPVCDPRKFCRLEEVGQATRRPIDFERDYFGGSVVLDCRLIKEGPLAASEPWFNQGFVKLHVQRQFCTGGLIYAFGACLNLGVRQTDDMAESTVGWKKARQTQSWAKTFSLGSLIMSSLLLSTGVLPASPQRPYVHELFGLELLISWPEGQKLHEEVMLLYYAGDYTAADQKLDKVIADAEEFSKAKEKDTAILLTTKAEQIMLLGDTEEANTLLLRAQELADRALATNHPVTERIQSDRALVFFVRGNPAEAKVALERAIATQTGRSGTNDVAYARCLNHKALMCLAQGDPAQASVLMDQSSQIIEKAVGTQSPLYGQNEALKSQIAAANGEYEKAVRLCESSLTTLTNCLGPEHLILVSVRKALADDYQQLGMYEQAAPLLQANLQTLEKTIARDNIVLSGVLNSLGLLQYRLGNYADAERLFQRCLAIQDKSLGVNSPGFAATVNNLALALDAAGKADDLSKMFKYASAALRESCGSNCPELATVLLNWGMFSQRFGNFDTAKRFFEEAITIRNMAFGKDHPSVAEVAEAGARLQCDLGDFKYADQLASLALSTKTNFYGLNHPAIADSFNLAGRIYEGQGDDYRATEFYAKSAGVRAKAFGAEHPTVASDLEAAGLALCRAGDYDEAVRPFLAALGSQKDYLVQQVSRASGTDGLRLAGITFYRTEIFHSLCAQSFSNATAYVPAIAAEQLASCKALLEEVQATQASLDTDSRTSAREQREKLDAIQTQLLRLPESNLGSAQREARRRQLQIEKTQIEGALAEWNYLVSQTIRERKLTLADIAWGLPRQSVLVDFIKYRRYDFAAKTNHWQEQRYAAYLTFPLARDATNVVVERVDLGEAAPINAAVEFICRRPGAGLSPDSDSAKKLEANCRRLSELVYAPLARHLANVSHLIVCPDGQLSRLPFEMLPVGNKFLVEEK